MKRLGARSVPIVSRGDEFVFAQVIHDVVSFLELDEDTSPELSPVQLAEGYDAILEAAIRLVAQMPDDQLENQLPDRPRSWRMLLFHVFQIPTAFLDMEETGKALTYENLVATPPPGVSSTAAITEFGHGVRGRFTDWWNRVRDEGFDGPVPTYFGETSRHEMLERTVWHTAQHVRQVGSLLEETGIKPDRPLTSADLRGLPLTDRIWD